MYTYTYIYTYIHVYVYIYIYIDTYTYTYTCMYIEREIAEYVSLAHSLSLSLLSTHIPAKGDILTGELPKSAQQ